MTRYDMRGWVEDMPELSVARQDHGCAGYTGDHGELVLLVTGGYNGYYLTHTEILSGGQWSQVGSLSRPVYGLSGARLGDRTLMTGGMDVYGADYDFIVEYDIQTQEWTLAGRMMQPRRYHAVVAVDWDNVNKYCY